MSLFMPDAKPQERESAKGPEAYLSPDERKALQRSLSFPEDLPPKFKSWLIDFIAVNIPQIPVSQLVGFKQVEQVEVSSSLVTTSETTTSTSYTDLATVGPAITGLRNGQYVILFGYNGHAGGSGGGSAMSVSINGATASDNDWVTQDSNTIGIGVSRAVVKTLSSGDANTITGKYKSWSAAQISTYRHRWLVAQRFGPVPV